MRSIAMLGVLAALSAAAPLSAQGKFRTGDINPKRGSTGTIGGSVLGGVLGSQLPDTARNRRSSDHIPPGHRPPAGMCRIWIDGVPPGQQPAPTDCQTAVATKPANARVIWGDQTAFPGNGKGKFKHKDRDDDDRIRGIGRDDDDDRDRRIGRNDDDDDDRFEGRKEHRGRGKSIAKRGKKG